MARGGKIQMWPMWFVHQYEQGLRKHKRSSHEGVRYSCPECDSKYSHPQALRNHVRSVHEGRLYECDQCDYKAALKPNIEKHKLSKHEGVRFKCALCPRTFSTKGILHKHNRIKHIVYDKLKCPHCEWSFSGEGQSERTRHTKAWKWEVLLQSLWEADQYFWQKEASETAQETGPTEDTALSRWIKEKNASNVYI